MRNHFRKLGPLLAATGFLVGFAGQAGADPALPFTNDKVDRIISSGSDTTYFLMNDLAKAYMESDGCKLNGVAITGTSFVQQNVCQAPPQSGVVTTENYDHDVAFNYFPQGSGAGLRQLCAQSDSPVRDSRVPFVDIARSSSSPAVGFQCTVPNGAPANAANATNPVVFRFIAIARDALDWVSFPPEAGSGGVDHNVFDLTQAQLNDIYVDCTISTWGQLNGNPSDTDPIVVWTAISASGSTSTWNDFVGGDSTLCIPTQFKNGNTSDGERVIREHFANLVVNQPNGAATPDPGAINEGNSIFWMSVGTHNIDPERRSTSRLGRIGGITPTEETINDGTFTAGRFLYNVIRNSGASPNALGANRRFTNSSGSSNPQTQGWICKSDAAHSEPVGTPGPGIENAVATEDYGVLVPAIIRKHGFIPLSSNSVVTDPGRRCFFDDWSVTNNLVSTDNNRTDMANKMKDI